MDEQRLRDLLDLASREYNDGTYSEAIAHWQEALQIDPSNQKAREGIRMAQLLVVNWESPEREEGAQELAIVGAALDAETQEKIEFGISRVRELMAAGRIQEAMEGCQLLQELAPGADSVRRLAEEVTQIFEAQPFIKDRLERARKHLAQGKVKEAAEEARNVLSVDHGNQEAQEILRRGGGPAPAPPPSKAPSAFQVEKEAKPAPPSPFSVGPDTDALLAQFEFEEPGRTATGPQRAAPSSAGASEPAPFEETEFGLDGPAAAPPAPPAGAAAQSASLLQEGRALIEQKRYQEAIDALAQLLAVEPGNAEAERLIEEAKGKFEEIGRRVDEAYFRGIDFFESGNFADARRAFEEVVSLQPDHAEARGYLRQIEEAAAARKAPAAPPKGAEKIVEESVPLAAPSPRAEPSSPPPAALKAAPATSAGVIKKKPVAPAPRRGRGRIIAVAGILAVVVITAVAVAFFLMGGAGQEPSSVAVAPPSQAAGPLPVQPPPPAEAAAAGAAAGGPGTAQGRPGSLEVVPGASAPKETAPAAPDPATMRRRVDTLLREGRGLLSQQKYVEAMAAFEQALALDPANFDAEELRASAAGAAAEQARFNKELEAAKTAFRDSDWGGALYKFYRLREERRDMQVLRKYIENANYNWGIESLVNFEIEAALEHFKDALEMDPGDASLQRHVEVATRYKRRQRDAAFGAYVARLKPRALEE